MGHSGQHEEPRDRELKSHHPEQSVTAMCQRAEAVFIISYIGSYDILEALIFDKMIYWIILLCWII